MDVSSNLRNCRICPRQCGVNRLENASGYCRSGKLPMISSICIHHGEEPAISGEKGICNVFFAHCNLRCVYCQNHQISRNNVAKAGTELSIDEAAKQIAAFLDQGIDRVGFVSPTHFSVQMTEIVDALHSSGYFPTIVYNSNGYDEVSTLEQLSDYIDVYLPDLKYLYKDIAT
ncbi:radical SAM protein, partial [Bacteroidales bacterium OttesenSCG-928-J16]|nr:radical SAM protein [Bacteroidales bacterium OttesenSCG-928-J16]